MNNLVRCRRCKQTLIREEWDGHVCDTPFKGVRNIEVLDWWETRNDNDERTAFGLGADGYTYKLVEPKEGFIEIDPNIEVKSRDLTERKGDNNLKEPLLIMVNR